MKLPKVIGAKEENVSSDILMLQKNKMMIFLIVSFLFLLNFFFILGLWLQAVVDTKSGFRKTLSSMLVIDPYAHLLYIIQFSTFSLQTIVIDIILITDDLWVIDNEDDVFGTVNKSLKQKHYFYQSIYASSTASTVVFSILLLIGLLYLWLFPTDGTDIEQTSHTVFTSVAAISSMIRDASLFARRLTVRINIFSMPYSHYVIPTSAIFLLAEITMGIVFGITRTGESEFAFAMLSSFNLIFVCIDLYYDANCYYKLYREVDSYLKRVYMRFDVMYSPEIYKTFGTTKLRHI